MPVCPHDTIRGSSLLALFYTYISEYLNFHNWLTRQGQAPLPQNSCIIFSLTAKSANYFPRFQQGAEAFIDGSASSLQLESVIR